MKKSFSIDVGEPLGIYQITLWEVWDILRALPDLKVSFGNPHSYCGEYRDIAFEPFPCESEIKAGDLANELRENVIGKAIEGYKGGSFIMGLETKCWVSSSGYCSGPALIGFKVIHKSIKPVTLSTGF